MIADATFGPAGEPIRRLRFVPRPAVRLEAACAVAERIADALRELLGDRCELVIGEPAAVVPESWALLSAEALLFLNRGRQTDTVLVLPYADAGRLVRHAFGERHEAGVVVPAEPPCSALEMQALDRIAARCAVALAPLSADGASGIRRVQAAEVPRCAAYFDIRVRAPLPLAIGIGIVREPPEPPPAVTLSPSVLEGVSLEARAVFAEGRIDAANFVHLRPGDVVRLETKVGARASLNCESRRLASGTAGVVASRTAFLVHDVASGAH